MIKRSIDMINKNGIIDLINKDTGITKKTTGIILDSLFDNIIKAVAADETVNFVNFGKFMAKHRDAYSGTNPQTGETIVVEAHSVPQFKASETFKNAIR
jgi:DNA-binding protein HU-beta